jgi:PIN domain nuclease of toxin-antitoxin system
MKYLLDTHFVIWSVTETDKLSERVKDILVNRQNDIFVSTISFWEISLKSAIGKLDLGEFIPENFPKACINMGFELIDLKADIVSTYHHLLSKYHKDPFDRMLIWQAIKNDYTLISDDENVKKYIDEGLKIVF